nr:hypothetical protein BaRGS_023349 [Batillaria attramentaria]
MRWRLQHPKYNPEDRYHLLGRREQVKLFCLMTGHNRLYHHMHTKLGIGQSGECPCAVETKLYGTLEELRWTAAFIENTGLLI